jgi:uncharacterized protein
MFHVVISPSKTQDFKPSSLPGGYSPVLFKQMSNYLVSQLKQLSANKLEDLMGISPKLALLNYNRFQKYQMNIDAADEKKPAVFAYTGDTYKGLNIKTFNAGDFEYAQHHLSIISGLYGVLRPLDLIQPYRLEMSTKRFLDINLYAFWSEAITEYFNQHPDGCMINLASQEYSTVINRSILKKKLIDVIFYQRRNGGLKTIGLLAKKARGCMAAFIIKHRIASLNELIRFSEDGYIFQPDQSTADTLIFIQEVNL